MARGNSSIYGNRVARRVLREAKRVLHRARPRGSQQVLFILGCQRSGTALLSRVLERDTSTSVYKEVSPLSARDKPKMLRLNPLEEVAAQLGHDRASLVVLKPLVESQNADVLLETFAGSRAVWMFRDYRDVAASYIQKWGPHRSIDDLRAIVTGEPDNWRTERVRADVRDSVVRHFADDMTPADASALYWYVRNRFFFDLQLPTDPRVRLSSYEKLVSSPEEQMRRVYELLGRPFPGVRILKEITPQRIGRGTETAISPPIETLCRDLLARMDDLA